MASRMDFGSLVLRTLEHVDHHLEQRCLKEIGCVQGLWVALVLLCNCLQEMPVRLDL